MSLNIKKFMEWKRRSLRKNDILLLENICEKKKNGNGSTRYNRKTLVIQTYVNEFLIILMRHYKHVHSSSKTFIEIQLKAYFGAAQGKDFSRFCCSFCFPRLFAEINWKHTGSKTVKGTWKRSAYSTHAGHRRTTHTSINHRVL